MGEVSLIDKGYLTGGDDEYINVVDAKKSAQQIDGINDTISCLNLNTYHPAQVGQRKSNETDSEGPSSEKSQRSSSIRVFSEPDDRTERSFESIIDAGKTYNKALSRKGSLEYIEWSGEERVFYPETKSPLSKTEFYSNWKQIINHQDIPKTPQFRATCAPPMPYITDSDEFYSDISSSSFKSLPDSRKEIPSLRKDNQNHKNQTRRINGISLNQYEGANELNYNYSTPSLPISNSHIQGRNRLDILLSQWVNYFSGRQSIDINDIEYATQFFTGLDGAALAAATSSLLYIGQCARCTQVRKFSQG
ncbi:hypothetical protein OJ253_1105 [Cryptosporidium canis]|uniref:Uncharacterized protein n=1 Tax=Cryptosporidium canis TaxID=195482 RepID=A0A9D5DJT4_9CRYT|nr:hypothetical protein OJ253_1105 [Cryptosporidium canis]